MQTSNLPDEVRLLGGVLIDFDLSSGCAGFACEPAKLADQVRFLAGTLHDASIHWPCGKEGAPCLNASTTNSHCCETMSKRRKGFPSETNVKRGVRIVRGDKLLEEELGRNDLCLCGSGKRFQKCCLESGCF